MKCKDIEGNTYKTIKIGTQVWTAESLKTTKYNDGTSINHVTDRLEWSNLTTPAYCYYDNDIGNKRKYGVLYNWYAVNTGNLAPKGWHLPTFSEWEALVYLEKNAINPPALSGGYRNYLGNFNNIGNNGYWWGSTERSFPYAHNGYLCYNDEILYSSDDYKVCGFSVRLVKD